MTSPSASSQSVLVVDDEPTIREIVSRYLERAGYRTSLAADGPQAVAMSAREIPDLVVLDIMLPGFDGFEVMRLLHDRPPPRPAVILLTAKGEESDRIVGLGRGADDYIAKPFSPRELVARVQAVLRRTTPEPASREPMRFEGLEIDPIARSVTLGEEQISLSQREFDLLAFLAANPGQVFSRDQLMELVWQCSYYNDSSTVTVHIRRLRAKVEPRPDTPRFIQTVWGVGYRFCP
jgi:two-component system, OmpR family, response regulator ResD